MPQESQQNNGRMNWGKDFNILSNLSTIHQRGIVVPFREGWGKNALGTSCALAFVLIFFWAGFTHDSIMLGWLLVWTIFYLIRRDEANKLRGQVHTWQDGRSALGSNQRLAKMLCEPVLVGIFGLIMKEVYLEYGLPTAGLPTFLLTGCFTLPMVECVKQAVLERQDDDMNDAVLEAEERARRFRDRHGK